MMKCSTAAIIALLAVLAQPAHAALIELSLIATVREATGLEEFDIDVGTQISLTFLLDSSVPGEIFGDNIWFAESVVSAELVAGTLRGSIDPAPNLNNQTIVRNGENGDFDAVSYSAGMILQDSAGGTIGDAGVSVQFVDASGLLVEDDSFPAMPDFAQADGFDDVVTGVGGTYFNMLIMGLAVEGEISNPTIRVVPIPGALVLLGSGVAAMLGIRRKRVQADHRRAL